ncbi:CAMK/CAMK1 protein kinase [Saprolegnia parasitica CBS 223.65]|uniref:CAMK/CAMK1 protein kinase n=1 Tax=Saprolegnia parasitica (strain CBS 223.65) TaxID=695850 RepID=A0A067BYJ4_SAPPC|nr:CAMK/CAMK1 protein kinase [Saprolegnia parasitica CBS 223.65]KDO23338.1 CAMK/CAMK1 protein kinase [Saprolegnia parasitica CBS 223.65]|eukprot:XP_012205990.1 CAMK/CAMK1 protein kinase [Saprolegnia parasitica CBS 223.65]
MLRARRVLVQRLGRLPRPGAHVHWATAAWTPPIEQWQRVVRAVAALGAAASAVMAVSTDEHVLGATIQDDYAIMDDVIGEGGFCVVRKARDRRSGDVVAVKEMSKQTTSSKDFWAEVDLLKVAGAHNNIMALRGVYESADSWYIVQELATGGELFDHLVANGAYSEKMASNALRDLCQAMHYLHRKGIVHGDIKPENIMLRGDELCLVDFGVSFRMGERSSDVPITGTPAYCAPEAFTKQSVGPEADMFALGIVLYILLCGSHPFDTFNTLSDQEIGKRIVKGQYNTQTRAWRRISSEAKDLIQKLLVVDPAKRLSAYDALRHPWLSPHNASISAQPLHKAAAHLQRFQRGRRRLRASILAVLLQPPVDDDDDDKRDVDDNDDANIAHFARGVSSNPETAAEKAAMLASTLSVFDQDRKGYISDDDLRRVAAQLGKQLSDSDIREMLAAATGDPEIPAPKQLTYDDIKLAICSLRSGVYENGAVISAEGDEDHHFYVLMEGTVHARCANPMAPNSVLQLRTLEAGEYFGVMELLAPDAIHPRVATYACASPTCKVLKLLREDLANVSNVYKVLEASLTDRAMGQAHAHLLQSIEDAHGSITHTTFKDGDYVYRQGDVCDSYYIIADGAVDVIMDNIVVERLTTGDCFPLGVAADSNPVRRASARCSSDTTVIEIKGEVFRSFLCSYRFMTAFFENQLQARRAERRGKLQQVQT